MKLSKIISVAPVILSLASLLVVEGCAVSTGEWPKGTPPATLYVFNVDPPDGDIMVFRQVPKPRSFEQVFFGERPYYFETIALVSSQRFVQVLLPAGDQNLRGAPWDKAPSLIVSADPVGVYYVKVYRPKPFAWVAGLIAGELVTEVFTLGWGEDVLTSGLLRGRPAYIESITSDEAQDLMKQLKPQEVSEPRNTSG